MNHKEDGTFVSLHCIILYFTCIKIKKEQGAVELCHFRGIRVTQVKNMSVIRL